MIEGKKEFREEVARKPYLIDGNGMLCEIAKADPPKIIDGISKIALYLRPTSEAMYFYNLDYGDYPTGYFTIVVPKNNLRPLNNDGSVGRVQLFTDIFGRPTTMSRSVEDLILKLEVANKSNNTLKIEIIKLTKELRDYKIRLGEKFREDERLKKLIKTGSDEKGPDKSPPEGGGR